MEDNKIVPAAPEGEAVHLDAAYVIAKIEQIMVESANLRNALDTGTQKGGNYIFPTI